MTTFELVDKCDTVSLSELFDMIENVQQHNERAKKAIANIEKLKQKPLPKKRSWNELFTAYLRNSEAMNQWQLERLGASELAKAIDIVVAAYQVGQ